MNVAPKRYRNAVHEVAAMPFDGSLESMLALREWLGDDVVLDFDRRARRLRIDIGYAEIEFGPESNIVRTMRNGHLMVLSRKGFHRDYEEVT